MFNSVEFVRTLCQERKIAVSKLEKDLGYGNGYFNAKKQSKIPYDRAVEIAEYLSVSPELILTGEENKKTPTDNVAGGLQDTKYGNLSPENRKLIDSMIEKLLKSQSDD